MARGAGGVGAGDCEPSDTTGEERQPPPSFPACPPTEGMNGDDSLEDAGHWLSRSWLHHSSQQDPNKSPTSNHGAPLQEGLPASATCRGFRGSAPVCGKAPDSSGRGEKDWVLTAKRHVPHSWVLARWLTEASCLELRNLRTTAGYKTRRGLGFRQAKSGRRDAREDGTALDSSS